MIRLPPGATRSYIAFCVSGVETASTAYKTGLLVICATLVAIVDVDARSITCIAPRDLRYASLCFEAVAMMGEKPFMRAAWIAAWGMA